MAGAETVIYVRSMDYPTTYLRRHRVENLHLQYEHRQKYTHSYINTHTDKLTYINKHTHKHIHTYTHTPAHTFLCKTNINMHIPTNSVIKSIKLC